MLLIWGANTDQKIITDYPQLLNYLLKYIIKNETQSDFFTNIAKTVIGKLDDDGPVRKSVQKILMGSVGQRDMSKNECMLIMHGLPHVKYSKTPRFVNLLTSTTIKKKIALDEENILCNDNWADMYWNRDCSPGFKELCKIYDN